MRTITAAIGLSLLLSSAASARELSFSERVAAQEAVERVYYAHQLGATVPFEQAVPRAVLEAKVRTYLKQSAALESIWNTPVTAEMLERELARMAEGSRMPERLRELFGALGNDPFLVQECLARPALVDRLSRNFFAMDVPIHGEARGEAETLREAITSGTVDPKKAHARRIAAGTSTKAAGLGPIADHPESFSFEAVDDGQSVVYSIPKKTWDAWWDKKSASFNLDARSVARQGGALPHLDSAPCSANDTWDNRGLGTPTEARWEHTAVWTGSLMLVWGGWDGNSYPATGMRYDPATDTWSPMSRVNAPRPRRGHTAVWTSTRMIVWGGYDTLDNGSASYKGGAKYDPVTDAWQPISGLDAPSGRAYHTAVWTGSKMIVWGGGPTVAGQLVNTGGVYDPASDTWIPTATSGAPTARYRHTTVWTGSKMIVWGGNTSAPNDTGPVNTGAVYDPAADSWTATTTSGAPVARAKTPPVWTGTHMVVWFANAVSGGGRYDPATDTWSPVATGGAPGGRSSHTAVWTGTHAVFFGGTGNGITGSSTGGRYDPQIDAWLPMATSNAPEARFIHTAVWTGSQMIVWGGTPQLRALQSGGRYDPATDSWTPTALRNTPQARLLPTAVWTGNHMIVWGGAVINNFATVLANGFQTGGKYDPVLDTWTPTTLVNAPSGRVYHVAAWSGNKMIVWGGVTAANASGTETTLSTGGQYDPVLDTWVATSATNVPTARKHAGAVWTGNRMVIWGGEQENGAYLTTGSRFDPATNSWAATATAGAPTTDQAVFFWTGSRVIVWGWNYAAILTKIGALYDPVADAWTPMSNVGAPASVGILGWVAGRLVSWRRDDFSSELSGGRYDPATNTWASMNLGGPNCYEYKVPSGGNRMYLWGQGAGAGAIYDAAADTWTPMSPAGAPGPRHQHAAVWAGDSLLVWSGASEDDGQPLADGGRYFGVYGDDADGDGFSGCAGDCDDTRADMRPGAPELCDHLDNDCDGAIPSNELDADRDGYSVCGGDCNDANAAVRPGAAELCDGFDTDCSGGVPASEADADGDGVRVCSGDCDDTRATVKPGAVELCDGLANNCSTPGWPALPLIEQDNDGDGYVECSPYTGPGLAGGDCDDARATRYPNAPETNNGLEDQCSGNVGFGAIDEISGTMGFFNSGDDTVFSWPAQAGATSYEVARSRFPDFHAGCTRFTTSSASFSDPVVPPSGTLVFYVIRAAAPFLGSWGQVGGSGSPERNVCAGCTTTGDWCDDDSLCTTGDVCSGTSCTGVPVNCDDGNLCTNDSCDPVLGCLHVNDTSACNDGNVCTTDSCSPATGCVHTNNTLSCDDGNACTSGDVCLGGYCEGTLPAAANHLLISQVQVEGDGASAAEDEFVEIYNPTGAPLSLSGKSLQWKTNAGGAVYSKHNFGNVSIPAHGWFLLARSGYNGAVAADELNPDFPLANVVGNLFLVNDTVLLSGSCPVLTTVIDKVSYGTGACPEGGAAASQPPPNDSILRKPGGSCGSGTDTDNNAADFQVQSPATPHNTASAPQPPPSHLVISQVQVEGDGASPAEDEFVEIYNPTGRSISLAGKSLQWKTNAGGAVYSKHNFGNVSVPAHGWFLLARAGYNGAVAADELNPDFPLANVVGNLFLVNDTVLLSGACPDLATVTDKVSYGTGFCPEGGAAAPQPPPNDSILRKPGGVSGNGTDTDNNANDFTLSSPSAPRNSASTPQP